MIVTVTDTGLINLDALPGTGQERIELGIDRYLDNGGRDVKGITWTTPITLTRPVTIPAEMIIKPSGRHYNASPNLKANLDDRNASALVLEETRTGYAYGHHLENMNIRALSPCKALIDAGNGSNQVFHNCELDGREMTEYGILIGGEDADKAVNSIIEKTTITRCRYGVYYDQSGMNHTIRDGFIRHCSVGVAGEVRKLHIAGMMGMKNDVPVKVAGAQIVTIENTYFENDDLYFSGVGVLSITGSRAIKYIHADDVKIIRIVRNMAGVSQVDYKGGQPVYLEIAGNCFTMDTPPQSLASFRAHGGNEYRIEGNYTKPIQ